MATYNPQNENDIVNDINRSANFGDTVRLPAGHFFLSEQLIPDVGVNIIGPGRNQCFLYWNDHLNAANRGGNQYKQWYACAFQYGNRDAGWSPSERISAGGAEISGFSIVGGNGGRYNEGGYRRKRIYGGILLRAVSDFTFRDIGVYDFVNVGVRLMNVGQFKYTDGVIDKCGWGNGSSYRLAQMIGSCIEDFEVSYIKFVGENVTESVLGGSTSGAGGGFSSKESERDFNPYNAENAGHDPFFYIKNGTFAHNDFSEIYPESPWAAGGSTTGSLDLEFHNCYVSNVDIKYNKFQGTLSLVQRDDRIKPERGEFAIRVFGNEWVKKAHSFPIENIYPRVEYFENIIRGGHSGPICARFEHWDPAAREPGSNYCSFHDNYVFEVSQGSYAKALFYYRAGSGPGNGELWVDNVWIFNNTIDASGANDWGIIEVANGNNVPHVEVSNLHVYNNIFLNLGSSPRTARTSDGGFVRRANLRNNMVVNGDLNSFFGGQGVREGANSAENFSSGDAGFQGGDGVPNRFFLRDDSPAIDRGIDRNSFGIPAIHNEVRGVTGAPNLGASEEGRINDRIFISSIRNNIEQVGEGQPIRVDGEFSFVGEISDFNPENWVILVGGNDSNITDRQINFNREASTGSFSFNYIYFTGNRSFTLISPEGIRGNATLPGATEDEEGPCSIDFEIIQVENCSGGTYFQPFRVNWEFAPEGRISIICMQNFGDPNETPIYQTFTRPEGSRRRSGSMEIALELPCDGQVRGAYVLFADDDKCSSEVKYINPAPIIIPIPAKCSVSAKNIITSDCIGEGENEGSFEITVELDWANASSSTVKAYIDDQEYGAASFEVESGSSGNRTLNFFHPCDGSTHTIEWRFEGGETCNSNVLDFRAPEPLPIGECKLSFVLNTPVDNCLINGTYTQGLQLTYENVKPGDKIELEIEGVVVDSFVADATSGTASLSVTRPCVEEERRVDFTIRRVIS